MEPLLSYSFYSYNFIFHVFYVNCRLLFTVLRVPKFYQSPKFWIVVSMAVGDIVLTLFPLLFIIVVKIRQDLFSCASARAAEICMFHLLNFVYSLDLVALGAEVTYRSKIQTTGFRTMISLIYIGAPWFLALIYVLPLRLMNMEPEQYECKWIRHFDVTVSVSILTPASFALLVAMTLYVRHILHLRQRRTASQSVEFDDNSPLLPAMPYLSSVEDATGSSPNDRADMTHAEYHPYLSAPNTPPGVPINLDTGLEPQPQQQRASVNSMASITVACNETYRTGKELQLLLLISGLHFLMVVPTAAIVFSSEAVKSAGSFWMPTLAVTLMVARSFVTPAFMIDYCRM